MTRRRWGRGQNRRKEREVIYGRSQTPCPPLAARFQPTHSTAASQPCATCPLIVISISPPTSLLLECLLDISKHSHCGPGRLGPRLWCAGGCVCGGGGELFLPIQLLSIRREEEQTRVRVTARRAFPPSPAPPAPLAALLRDAQLAAPRTDPALLQQLTSLALTLNSARVGARILLLYCILSIFRSLIS